MPLVCQKQSCFTRGLRLSPLIPFANFRVANALDMNWCIWTDFTSALDSFFLRSLHSACSFGSAAPNRIVASATTFDIELVSIPPLMFGHRY